VDVRARSRLVERLDTHSGCPPGRSGLRPRGLELLVGVTIRRQCGAHVVGGEADEGDVLDVVEDSLDARKTRPGADGQVAPG